MYYTSIEEYVATMSDEELFEIMTDCFTDEAAEEPSL